LRRLGLLALVLCGLTQARAQPGVEMTLAPAWNGWSRPGRSTEIEVRLRSETQTRGVLELVAGQVTVRAEVTLEAGHELRLHVPIGSAESVVARLEVDGAADQRREVGIAQAEAPLLGLAVATGSTPTLAGFQPVTLAAVDFPRDASAYSSIDALVLDAATLGMLDQRQLAALVSHAAACGRIGLVAPEPGALRLLEAAAGCNAAMLVAAGSAAETATRLQETLAMPAPSPPTLSGLGDLVRPQLEAWQRALLMVVAYLGLAALAVTFRPATAAIVPVAALAALVVQGLLHLSASRPELLVWAEAGPTARVAQFQAWQRSSATARGHAQVRILPKLGAVRACVTRGEVRFNLDAASGRAQSADVEARLFQPIVLCYSGSFPVMRSVSIDPGPGASLIVRNAGTLAWPAGRLVGRGLVHDLPALGPGESARLAADDAGGRLDAATRAAASRAPLDGHVAFWPLELGGVAEEPMDAQAWLLVRVPPRS
jgi:hypothetical protein